MLSIFILFLFAVLATAQNCQDQVRLRAEWRDLDNQAQLRFLQAITKMRLNGVFDNFSQLHLQYMRHWHSGPQFLAAHRMMLHEFDKELRKIDETAILPYWDWSLDADAPAQSSIWYDFGIPKKQSCISSSVFGTWDCKIPNQHCLVRGFDFGDLSLSTFPTASMLGEIVRNTRDFVTFSNQIEYGPHSLVHVTIGGDMSFGFSPNDPIFFLPDPANRLRQYQGLHVGRSVSTEDTIVPFDMQVNKVLNTLDLCYIYVNPNTTLDQPISTSSTTATSVTENLSASMITRTMSLSVESRSSSTTTSLSSSVSVATMALSLSFSAESRSSSTTTSLSSSVSVATMAFSLSFSTESVFSSSTASLSPSVSVATMDVSSSFSTESVFSSSTASLSPSVPVATMDVSSSSSPGIVFSSSTDDLSGSMSVAAASSIEILSFSTFVSSAAATSSESSFSAFASATMPSLSVMESSTIIAVFPSSMTSLLEADSMVHGSVSTVSPVNTIIPTSALVSINQTEKDLISNWTMGSISSGSLTSHPTMSTNNLSSPGSSQQNIHAISTTSLDEFKQHETIASNFTSNTTSDLHNSSIDFSNPQPLATVAVSNEWNQNKGRSTTSSDTHTERTHFDRVPINDTRTAISAFNQTRESTMPATSVVGNSTGLNSGRPTGPPPALGVTHRPPSPLPMDYIQRMGYNISLVRSIENATLHLYQSVHNRLKRGVIVPGPGVSRGLNGSTLYPTQDVVVSDGYVKIEQAEQILRLQQKIPDKRSVNLMVQRSSTFNQTRAPMEGLSGQINSSLKFPANAQRMSGGQSAHVAEWWRVSLFIASTLLFILS